MPILEIDGIGRVEVDKSFLSLPPDRQASEVDAIAASIRPQAPASAPAVAGGEAIAAPAPVQAQASAASQQPPGAVGRVMQRAGEVAADRYGDRPLGLSDQSLSDLVDRGVIAKEGTTATPIQLLNQIVYQYGSKAGDLALRTIAAAIGGVQGAAGQTAEELGASPGMARRLERDVGMGIESAGVVAGGPTAPRVPRAPVAAAAEAAVPEGATAVAIKAPAAAADFKAASQGFYKQFEDAGVMVKPQSYSKLSDDIFATAAKNRLNPTLTPGSMEAVKQIRELADPAVGPITFETLDTMRQLAGDARQAAKAGSNDARVAGLIIDKIDNYIATIKPEDVLAGDAQAAAKAIPVARELWSRAKNLETITDLIDRAKTSASQFSGSGFENALRTEFRSLAKNKERMKAFDADAQKAIKLVARGTTPTNAARFVGKLAPTGIVSGALSGGIGASVGTAIGVGPVAGAAATTSLGFIGRRIATALTQRSIRQLEDIVRQGGGGSKFAESSIGRGTALLNELQGQGQKAAAASAPASARDRLRQAPDGNYYLPDPKRPGKYLQLVP